MQNDAANIATGGAGITAPFWLQFVDPFLQATVALLGLAVLVLTVWNKVLEIKMKRKALRKSEEAIDDQ